MNSDAKNPKKKVFGRLTIGQSVFALVLAVILIGIGIPTLTPDGTANFTGVKHDAALNVLEFDRGMYSPGLVGLVTRAHVDNVEPSPQGKDAQGHPLRCTDDPNEIQYYSVAIRRIGIFGATYIKRTYKVCNTAG